MLKLKKIIVILILTIGVNGYAKINAVVSILPQVTFLKAIAGDKINISFMVKAGNSPHSYEPKPNQMRDISKADIYFTIGVEFENSWINRFKNQNSNMKIVSMDKGINKIYISNHKHNHHKERKDPHIWTSPNNVKMIARNILNSLIKIDYINKKYYTMNYNKFIENINTLDKTIKHILVRNINSKFIVFHPAWGYFANQYNLKQIAIEIDGKSPKPQDIIKLIKIAKKENISVILTAPEFSAKIATQIAKEVGVKVIKISPLNPNWLQNLLKLANSIKN